jgi:sugar lactone lactonase YvrE
LCVDADGGVWIALWGGWAVRHYAPDGRLLQVYRFPVSHVTSLAFGGDDLADLYVTTAWLDDSGMRTPAQKAAQPLAGGIFRLRPGPKGQRPNAYGAPTPA